MHSSHQVWNVLHRAQGHTLDTFVHECLKTEDIFFNRLFISVADKCNSTLKEKRLKMKEGPTSDIFL